ncbi:hypothetical protein AB0M95_28890 [Sphaerisporangium sp. NPDC051017]|uniref:cupredoxin domain-containing protein n=1 Tax=Sphaerisporangium sp. NPDC051017 TaxID=3154636 RepID=UPI00341996A3
MITISVSMAGLLCAAGCAVGQEDQTPPNKSRVPTATAAPLTSAETARIANGAMVRLTDAGPIPKHLITGVGTTITWKNDTAKSASVRLIDGTKPSGDIPPGGTFTHVFETMGSYAYRLTKDGELVGVVEVMPHETTQAVPSPSPTR